MTTTEEIPETAVGSSRAVGRIVLGVSFADVAPGPLAWAELRAQETAMAISVVHAWTPAAMPLATMGMLPSVGYTAWQDIGVQEAAASEAAATAVARLHLAGVEAAAITLRDSVTAAILSGLTAEDEVVVGIHPTGALRHALGTLTVHTLLRHAPCAVVVVPEKWTPPPEGPSRLVVGYDWSPLADSALFWAIRECARSRCELLAVRAVNPLGDPQAQSESGHRLAAHVRDLALAAGVDDVVVHQVTAAPTAIGEALDEAAVGARALVVGNHRATWLAGATGNSITESSVLHAVCPVVVVP
jgi:nucleotide-binding universal stress UspA family protein